MTNTVPEEVTDRAKNNAAPSDSKLLGLGLKTWWLLLIRPIEDYLIDKKIHPNVLTVSSLIVSMISGLFFYFGLIFLAGLLMLSGSTFDIFDGRVARAQNLSSEAGAFFDSCLDRIAEAFIYLGLLGYFQGTVFIYVVLLIVSSTMMVSYAKARAEGLGAKCDVGIMQRTERVVYLGLFSVFNFIGNLITDAFKLEGRDYLLKFALIVMLIFSVYTVIQRMAATMKELNER
ncbi:MAG: CDP-alcohol phosphatidyltransferase family protein [Candidatus Dadabacteria bacterium]|nr:CDP-alcohol phosphatidyltransferase family protein [Candidatus Dadabacteria bacterium]NIV41175.1 hypothetical protein [Candidatus Dadabacteria bacterium]NIX14464.1 hypothetical protein [Candidatus Dadabacteria bacterium]